MVAVHRAPHRHRRCHCLVLTRTCLLILIAAVAVIGIFRSNVTQIKSREIVLSTALFNFTNNGDLHNNDTASADAKSINGVAGFTNVGESDLVGSSAVAFEGVKARVWKPWTVSPDVWCREPKLSKKWEPQRQSAIAYWTHESNKDRMSYFYKRVGPSFIKTLKTGSSTASSVNMLIALNVAKAKNKARGTNFPHCAAGIGHKTAHERRMSNDDSAGFLWSIVREPTKRMISGFFFFYVSRKGWEPTDETFKQVAKQYFRRHRSYYVNYLSTKSTPERTWDSELEHANKIMETYNFIAVTERMDESVVVLQLLLGLQTRDVLFLNSKKAGSYDDGRFNGTCIMIQKSFLSPAMKDYLYNPLHLDGHMERARMDTAIYRAVNSSLDLTIESLGKERFQSALSSFQAAQKAVAEKCNDPNLIPCSESNAYKQPRPYTCVHGDSGCGLECINRVADELGLPEYEYKPQ